MQNSYELIAKNREFLKSNWEVLENYVTDQEKGISMPPFEKPITDDDQIFDLPDFSEFGNLGDVSVKEVIEKRSSRRKYSNNGLSIKELAYLLWCTQGIRFVTERATFRTVPSAGARHPFETYVYALNVVGLEEAIYRYLPIEHKLVLHKKERYLREKIIRATLDQTFLGNSAAVFIWTAIPYRTEWRYGPAAHKAILLDAG
ncbi:MAG: SagB/ThcOx family dehydrogenase, partial [Fervidobacterium sp.]